MTSSLTAAPGPAISPAASGQSSFKSRSLLIASGLIVGWLTFLAWVTLTTANPVTINREQMSRATLIIQGRVEDLSKGTVSLQKTFLGTPPEKEVAIRFLSRAGAKQGESYIFPLEASDNNRFVIVPSRLPGEISLIYPAGEEAEQQTTEFLREQ
ncbi:hypothetical protein [Planctomicrobium sp. SH664]|uniref:hypothetical protein n=1 Tax=Planctomicrobium sp. SH664 TaxID=3448125 RepID=UPI003F5B9BDD